MLLEETEVVEYVYVIYLCGCRLANITNFPAICPTHKKPFWEVGPILPYGERFEIDSRHIC